MLQPSHISSIPSPFSNDSSGGCLTCFPNRSIFLVLPSMLNECSIMHCPPSLSLSPAASSVQLELSRSEQMINTCDPGSVWIKSTVIEDDGAPSDVHKRIRTFPLILYVTWHIFQISMPAPAATDLAASIGPLELHPRGQVRELVHVLHL